MDTQKTWSSMDEDTQVRIKSLYRRYKQNNDETAMSEIKAIFKHYNSSSSIQSETSCSEPPSSRVYPLRKKQTMPPEEMVSLECTKCKKIFEVSEQKGAAWNLANLQKGYGQEVFCSKECMLAWVKTKEITMGFCLILGIVLVVLMVKDISGASLGFLFVPYMIRQARHGLKDLFNGGWFGQFISFSVVLLGSVTFIYPIYKLVQEINLYLTVHKYFEVS